MLLPWPAPGSTGTRCHPQTLHRFAVSRRAPTQRLRVSSRRSRASFFVAALSWRALSAVDMENLADERWAQWCSENQARLPSERDRQSRSGARALSGVSDVSKLKIGAIEDDKPITMTIKLPAAVHRELRAYAEVLKREAGHAIDLNS